ncbi:uncharacterized protein [Amphiura filiformis]|uniref:uncharacterized protein n=1 Tax=Amphiura filiformis TaxID=82378 RepID=UPI003B216F4C
MSFYQYSEVVGGSEDYESEWVQQPNQLQQEASDVSPSASPHNYVVSAMTTTVDWLKVTGVNATASWMNVTDDNVTDVISHVNVTGVPMPHEGGHRSAFNATLAMILIPECIILFLFVMCVTTVGVMRLKWKRDEIAKDNAMNTDDLAFYQTVYKMTRKDSMDVCSTRLPMEMPSFGYFDADKPDKYKSLVPALKTDLNIIPGYIEVLRVQLRPRRSSVPENLRAVRSAPDTVCATDSDDPFGRQLHITTSSPAILVGLWNRYRSEIFRHQNEVVDLCPIHAEIQSMISGNSRPTTSDGRTSPPAYRGESEGFEFYLQHVQSSASTIPRKITCRFCRERAMRAMTPLTTPGTSPKSHRKRSHTSIFQSGLTAMADECGTLSTRALHSLGPVRIEHVQDKTSETSPLLQERSSPSYHDIEAAVSLEEIDTSSRGRRQSCKPEIQLEGFKAVLLNESRYERVLHGRHEFRLKKNAQAMPGSQAKRIKTRTHDGMYGKKRMKPQN